MFLGNVLFQVACSGVPAIAGQTREGGVVTTVDQLMLAQVPEGAETLLAYHAPMHLDACVNYSMLFEDACC